MKLGIFLWTYRSSFLDVWRIKYTIPSSFKAERYRKQGKLLMGRQYEEAKVRFEGQVARIIREEWPSPLASGATQR